MRQCSYRIAALGLAAFLVGAIAAPGSRAATLNVPSGPYPTIQSAITASSPGDTVLVADGTYTGLGNKDLDFLGKAITVRSQNGAASTIIDCQGSGRGFNFHLGETSTSVLDGFTITNGNVITDGGGIQCDNSDPTIRNCKITGNTAGDDGGGIACYLFSDPQIINCTITGNTAGDDGGGIACWWYSDPQIINCTINGNTADNDGGGIWCWWYCDPQITNCTITGNTLTNDNGGGIYCERSDPTITNCEIADNFTGSAGDGGGIYCYDGSSPTITNCTVANNWAFFYGGIHCYLNSSPTITNSIVWGNSYPDIYTAGGSVPTVTYSDVDDGTGESWFGTGCIEMDPSFVNPGTGNYRLQPDSPCIDSGYGDNGATVPTTDRNGNARYDHPQVANTGGGTPDYVDMGAYERRAPAADILWRNNTTGQVSIWLMNGMAIASSGSSGFVATAWKIKGTGDFDADGKADIVWRHDTTGQVAFWLMNGMAISSSGGPYTIPPAWGWEIKGTGDFDGHRRLQRRQQGRHPVAQRHDGAGLHLAHERNGHRQQRQCRLCRDRVEDQGRRRLQRRQQGRYPVAPRHHGAGRHVADERDGHIGKRRRLHDPARLGLADQGRRRLRRRRQRRHPVAQRHDGAGRHLAHERNGHGEQRRHRHHPPRMGHQRHRQLQRHRRLAGQGSPSASRSKTRAILL
jgi:parallel beta-helix repeat protein